MQKISTEIKTDKTYIASRNSALNVICWHSQTLHVFLCLERYRPYVCHRPAASSGILSPSEVTDAAGFTAFW